MATSSEQLDHSSNTTKRTIWKAILVILGYVLTLPVLLTMLDSPASTAINNWLTNGKTGAMVLLIVGTVLGWACWIVAAVLNRRTTISSGPNDWRGLVSPIVTAVTVLAAFCSVFMLPLLCLAHMQ